MHDAHAARTSAPGKLTIQLDDLYCLCCADELEAALRANPHVTAARVDFAARRATVEHHPGMLDEAGVRALIDESGRCRCEGDAADARAMCRLNHRAQVAELTVGGPHDRMQYEMPSTSAHAQGTGADGAGQHAHQPDRGGLRHQRDIRHGNPPAKRFSRSARPSGAKPLLHRR